MNLLADAYPKTNAQFFTHLAQPRGRETIHDSLLSENGGFWAFWLLPTWIRSISLEACFRLCMWPHLKDTYVNFYREKKWEMIVLAIPVVALNSKFRNYGTVNQWYQDKLLQTLLVIFRQTTSFTFTCWKCYIYCDFYRSICIFLIIYSISLSFDALNTIYRFEIGC